MIRYVYCMTKSDHWFDVAESLYTQKIAKPVIWLGDDYHKDKASNIFGTGVLSMLNHVHYPYKIETKDISIEDSGFFISENYLRAKDRCLKMMDRIDLYGQLSRIDREVFFNKLCMIFISAIEKELPKALLMAEAPHSHAQYLLYEICEYFGLEIAWFNNWMIGPIMNLQNMRTMEHVNKSGNLEEKSIKKYYHLVDMYISNFQKKWDGEFEHKYMIDQINSLKTFNKIKNFFKNDLEYNLRQSYRNIRDKIFSLYNPINPYNFGIFTQLKIKSKRRKNLYKFNKIFSTEKLPKSDFVFFALHYEHERNTNPDGGIYHEQLIALQRLRNFIPKNIRIVTKEHPTQIYHQERGPRGRSPLIYDLISNISGVTLLKHNFDSTRIQKNALFTASITGTASLEAAINGKKSIIFGNAWFKGCPNVYDFDNLESYDFLERQEIEDTIEISRFFKNQMKNYCIPANQNFSAELRNRDLMQENFKQDQFDGATDLIKTFFKNNNL